MNSCRLAEKRIWWREGERRNILNFLLKYTKMQKLLCDINDTAYGFKMHFSHINYKLNMQKRELAAAGRNLRMTIVCGESFPALNVKDTLAQFNVVCLWNNTLQITTVQKVRKIS